MLDVHLSVMFSLILVEIRRNVLILAVLVAWIWHDIAYPRQETAGKFLWSGGNIWISGGGALNCTMP